jgi:hypothetical protein
MQRESALFSAIKLLNILCRYHLATPNQTVPDWVQHLPEPERSEKIAFIRVYGSPNVFSQFQPHVTLACDENAAALSAAFVQKAPQVHGSWLPQAVSLGPTGPCGTVCTARTLRHALFQHAHEPVQQVLKGRDFVRIPLQPERM